MSVLGVTLVLFVLGIIGWLIINAGKLGEHFKENVEVSVEIRENLNPKDSAALVQYISTKPYVKEWVFTTKEMARKKYIGDGNEDWETVIDYNPLPISIDFKLKKDYVNYGFTTNDYQQPPRMDNVGDSNRADYFCRRHACYCLCSAKVSGTTGGNNERTQSSLAWNAR